MLRYAALLLGMTALVTGCKKEEAPEVDLGYTYFPTKVGTWVEYKVDSLWRDDLSNVRDSVQYELLERIMEHYTDDEGRPCERIHRFVKDDNGDWVVRDVWTSTIDARIAERTEENQRKLKLSFPVSDGRTWDSNALNTVEELEVIYRNEGDPWITGDLTFQRTVLVKNKVPPNAVVKRNFEERYADGVGMVSKYWEETDTQTIFPQPTPQDPFPSPIVNIVGWRMDMIAVAYGVDQ